MGIFMKKRFRSYGVVAMVCILAAGLCACGKKEVFQTSSLHKEYTNVKLVSIGGFGDVLLNEERSQEFFALLEDFVFEQTKAAGSLGEKSYSVIFLSGGEAVDSIQIFDDGRTIGYSGYFYELAKDTYDVEAFLALFEEQAAEDEAVRKASETEPAEEENSLLEEAEKSSNEETSYPAKEEDELLYKEGKTALEWLQLETAEFERKKMIPVPVGQGCKIDIDGDGAAEEIFFRAEQVDDYDSKILLSIGSDEKWTEELERIVAPNTEYYFIADLDSSDKSYEIAVLDDGPSGDPEFHFMRYKDGKLIYMGSVFTDTAYDRLTVKGDGKIIGSGRLSLLQTWAAPFSWYVDGDSIKLLEEEWYYPYVISGSENAIKQVKPVTVYEAASTDAARKVTEASAEIVTFGMTDNKNWVQFFKGDGTEGWIYLEDGFSIESGGENVPVTEVFENLNMAG